MSNITEKFSKVEFLADATHVKFYGVSEESSDTIDGKVYEIVRGYLYIDESSRFNHVVGWDFLPDSRYILLKSEAE